MGNPPARTHSIRNTLRRISRRYRVSDHLEASLPVFFPSSGSFWRYPQLAYSAANNYPTQIFRLMGALGLRGAAAPPTPVQAFAADTDARQLSELFDRRGSDKTRHGYSAIYVRLLNELAARPTLDILEIGIGTNQPHAISSMGRHGRPGASLRAFRDYLPAANIYGADLDAGTLFTEERIRTAVVDQTDPASFGRMTADLGCRAFDLIIDDGLHSTEANLNTVTFAIGALRPGGWLVIEDIPSRTLPAWDVIVTLAQPFLVQCQLLDAAKLNVFVAQLPPKPASQ